MEHIAIGPTPTAPKGVPRLTGFTLDLFFGVVAMHFLFSLMRMMRITISESSKDKIPRLGAALAFYTILSLSPLLVVVTGLAGMVFGEDAARGSTLREVRSLTGEDGARAVEMVFAGHTQSGGAAAAVIGLATLFIGASGVFAQLQDAIDTIWKADRRRTGNGIAALVSDRLLSFSLVCGLAFLLLVSLFLSALMSGFEERLSRVFPHVDWIALLNAALSFLLSAILFALIFRVLPHARPTWIDAAIGAGLTALLFAFGKHLIGLYLGKTAVGSMYGAAGSLVVLLVWVYYSTQIVLFGAEFTRIYAMEYGGGLLVVQVEHNDATEADASASCRPLQSVVP